MNCAEARRRLPEPESAPPQALADGVNDAPGDALQAHLQGCAPCRVELDGLREVDRRVARLGAYTLLEMPTLLVQLDRQLDQTLGGSAMTPRRRGDAGLSDPTPLGLLRRLLPLWGVLLVLASLLLILRLR